MDGDAGEKPGDDRPRQEVGDEAEAGKSAGDEERADQECERGRERAIFRRSGGGDGRHAAGEDRRDGRIGPDRELSARSESREGERAGHEGEKADLRRKSPEPRRRHLLRYGDGGKRQPGRKVAVEIRGREPGQRGEYSHQGSDVRDQKSEVRSQKSEVRSP